MSTQDQDAVAAEAPAPTVVVDGVREVASGVFVIPDRRVPLVPNIGIVLGDDAALVVDTGMGTENGARVLEAARELAGDRPLLLTVTHFHPEHGFGAHVFRPEATIVYNRAQAEELAQKGAGYLELFTTFGPAVADALEGVTLVPPHIVYDGEADLDLGGRRVTLRTWGLAHTLGDQVVNLPEERIVFCGDLVENRFFPIFPFFPPDDVDVDGNRWVGVLEEIERLGAELVVPGHGEEGGPELVGAVREYLQDVRDEVATRVGTGASADEIAADLEAELPGRYAGWDAPEWIGFAVRSFVARSA